MLPKNEIILNKNLIVNHYIVKKYLKYLELK